MPTYTNTSYVAKNVPTSGSTLVTVPGSNTIAVTSLVVANTNTSPITADVFFTRSAVDYYLVKTATIPVGGSLEAIAGNRVVLVASDVLKVTASANSSADCIVSALVTAG
jgi:hypothetical protein